MLGRGHESFVRLAEREALAGSFLVRQWIYRLGAAVVKKVATDGTGPLADAELHLSGIVLDRRKKGGTTN